METLFIIMYKFTDMDWQTFPTPFRNEYGANLFAKHLSEYDHIETVFVGETNAHTVN